MARRAVHLAFRLGKSQPFDAAEQEAYLNLVRTHAALTAPFDRLMRAHGISQPLYNILRILRGHLRRDARAGGGHAGVPVLRIRDEMVTREPDMTRLTARLEQAGLVRRVRCEEDRRVVYVRITEPGLVLLDRLEPEVERLHRAQFRSLTREELRALIVLLFKAAEPAGEHELSEPERAPRRAMGNRRGKP